MVPLATMTSNLIKERWSPYSLNATMSMKKLKDNTRASKIIHSHTHHKTNQIQFYSANTHPKPDNSYKPAPKL
jgi:hypothetical protein